jgi:imidazolonepropionase-like amidohydrolase
MIIKADRIITGDGHSVLEGKAIHIRDGKIGEIGELNALREKYPESRVQEYAGASILPGLIDMHVHLADGNDEAAGYNDFMLAYYAADYAKKAFSKGVTTIREVASPKNLCVSINNAAKQGFIEVPRIIFTDAGLCFTGGHAWDTPLAVEVDGPWAVRAAIRDAIKRGAQWIKVLTSHRSDTPEFTQEELNVAVDECHRVGKKAAVHAGTQPSIQMCIDAGFDTIEHGTYMTVAQAKQMADKGLVWVPTIVAYTKTYEEILQSMENPAAGAGAGAYVKHHDYFRNAAMAYKENFKKLYETGVKIVTGTDLCYDNAPVMPVATEMKYMADYGMPVLEVIRAASKAGAETLDLDHITGEIAPGKQADIVIVAGDPLQDIGAVEQVQEVFFGGKSVYQAG